MGRVLEWVVAAGVGLGFAPTHDAQGQTLSSLLKGHWTVANGDCQAGFTLQVAGDVLRWTDATGHVDSQRIIARRATGFATRPMKAVNGQPDGKAWVYEILAPGMISLIEGSVEHSAALIRCPDTLPPSATPRQIIAAIYARYAASDEPNLPLSGDANIRAFFMAGLADDIVAFTNHSGRLADDCRPADPFVPGAFGDYKVSQLHMDVASNTDGADHATARISFRNFGKPTMVSVALERTAAGWRIADVSPAPGQSFRANMAACRAPPK